MKVVLAISDKKDSTVLYVTDDGSVHETATLLKLVREHQVEGLHIVRRKSGVFLRANKKSSLYGLDDLTISIRKIIYDPTDLKKIFSEKTLFLFKNFYQSELIKREKEGDVLIAIDETGDFVATERYVREKIIPLKSYIFDASKEFDIDPYLLGGIIIDESVRLAPFERFTDKLLSQYTSEDISVGPAQVKLSVARGLIRSGYYAAVYNGKGIDAKSIHDIKNRELYSFVSDPKNNVFLAAAKLRYTRDEWKKAVNVELSDVLLAALYHLSRKPHKNPIANDRSQQITDDFYELAKKFLQ